MKTPSLGLIAILLLISLTGCEMSASPPVAGVSAVAPSPTAPLAAAHTPALTPFVQATVTSTATEVPTSAPTATWTATATSTSRPTPSHTPAPTATPAVPRVLILKAANIRGGPGTNYSVVASAKAGTEYEACGRNQAGDWVQLCGHRDPQWWVYVGTDLKLAEMVGSPVAELKLLDPIPTPPPIFTLSGTVFFDYNGNGMPDAGEPPIPGASIRVGSLNTTSAQDGTYSIRGILAGTQQVHVSAAGFRYISLSLAAFQPIDQPVNVTINGNTRHNLGLMQGFLTLPFHRSAGVYVQEYFDYDPAYYNYLWWNGERGIGIARNHTGTDLGVPQDGTPVIAPAPARVRETWADPNGGWCLNAEVADTTIYWVCHMRLTATANQIIKRGDLLGYVDFPSAPHVHLSVGYLRTDGGWHFDIRDIYVPAAPDICGEWRYPIGISTDPEFVRSACSPGYWTVKNSPQPFD